MHSQKNTHLVFILHHKGRPAGLASYLRVVGSMQKARDGTARRILAYCYPAVLYSKMHTKTSHITPSVLHSRRPIHTNAFSGTSWLARSQPLAEIR